MRCCLRFPAAAIDHEDALITLLRLRDEGRISAAEYERLRDAVADIPTVEETDLAMNVLWAEFMETDAKAGCDCLCSPFLGFEAGTPLETVLAWFDSHSRKGLKELTDHYEFTKMFMHSFAVEKDKAPK